MESISVLLRLVEVSKRKKERRKDGKMEGFKTSEGTNLQTHISRNWLIFSTI